MPNVYEHLKSVLFGDFLLFRGLGGCINIKLPQRQRNSGSSCSSSGSGISSSRVICSRGPFVSTTVHGIQSLDHLRGSTNAICRQRQQQFVVAEYHNILEITEWLFTARGCHSGQNTWHPCRAWQSRVSWSAFHSHSGWWGVRAAQLHLGWEWSTAVVYCSVGSSSDHQ